MRNAAGDSSIVLDRIQRLDFGQPRNRDVLLAAAGVGGAAVGGIVASAAVPLRRTGGDGGSANLPRLDALVIGLVGGAYLGYFVANEVIGREKWTTMFKR